MGNKIRKMIRKEIRDTNIKVEYSFVKILTGSDLSSRRLPIMSVKSINSGPTIWLTAGVHGEEVGGMVVIQEIFKKLKNNLLKGEVYALPLADPIGFETSSRVIVQSEEDLNRSFPGNKDGSLAERMADRIFTTIIKTNPDFLKNGDVAKVRLKPIGNLCLETQKENPYMARFAVRDAGQTVAAGMCIEITKKKN
jgi:predicted deacylase